MEDVPTDLDPLDFHTLHTGDHGTDLTPCANCRLPPDILNSGQILTCPKCRYSVHRKYPEITKAFWTMSNNPVAGTSGRPAQPNP